MTLKLYNTRTRQKEDFQPLDPKSVRMYVCGPTVYDFAHIGNARPLIVFDVLFRLLQHLAREGEWDGGKGETKVTYVRNITDVDDKINARAAQEGIPIRELTEKTAVQFHADAAALGCLPPSIEPRATEHIQEMISLIERLIERGHAYVADGHVLFDVASDPSYGSLARRSVDEMKAGARVEVAPYKRDAMDFVLWKPSTGDEPGWESRWGFGRPGWHLECSAMSEKYLGQTFDIHGGGIDLVFPHHENEVAQSTCAHGTKVMANVWMHNGHLQVEGQKMSKSLGNFLTIRDLVEINPGDIVRFTMLKTHYRQPLDWTETGFQASRAELLKLSNFIKRAMIENNYANPNERISLDNALPDGAFLAALNDDLNTPAAITRLHELYNESEEGLSGKDFSKFGQLVASLRLLGIRNYSKPFMFQDSIFVMQFESLPKLPDVGKKLILLRAALANGRDDAIPYLKRELEERGLIIDLTEGGFRASTLTGTEFESKINALVEDRLAARKAKNWTEADRIRSELADKGITLKDTKNPATGEIETTWTTPDEE